MMGAVSQLRERYRKAVWEVNVAALSGARAAAVKFVRIAVGVWRQVSQGQLTLRAMSLVYTTLLSLVPLIAVSFSVLKSFGVHNQVEPLLRNVFAPLGTTGREITAHILEFVDNMRVGVLGAVGLVMLIFTVITLLQKVEQNINYIWRVKQPRRFSQRFSEYLSVVLVGPVLVFSALGLTASLMGTDLVRHIAEVEPFGSLLALLAKLTPYVLVCGAFTFIYAFVPNTHVRLRSALVGGVAAGVLWETTGWAFAAFVNVSTSNYAAIYSGLAVLLVFMIWLYISWLILLIGAQVAYFHQYPLAVFTEESPWRMSSLDRERLALDVLYYIAAGHTGEAPRPTQAMLSERLAVSPAVVERILAPLKDAGFVVETAEEPPTYVPSRDLETIALKDVIDTVRRAEGLSQRAPVARDSPGRPWLESIENAFSQALDGASLRDLVSGRRPAEKPNAG